MQPKIIHGEIKSSLSQAGIYKKYVKRPLDVFLAISSLIVLSPILLILVILIRIMLGSPVIFKQKRPGLNEKIFTIYKFRTMTDERDQNGNLLPDKMRLTRFGRILRSTSLDELPEVFNILKGDMSFVGPRPQLVKDLPFMTDEQRLRHTVLPGLSGWAQVNGRNDVTWEDKLKYDLEYIRNITFAWDAKIIIMTIINVFKRKGINTKGMDTAEDLGDYLLRCNFISKEEYDEKIRSLENYK